MNANWVKLVSVAALALAGTLAVACSSDDDDDDNGGTQGKSGSAGTAGSAGGGSGTGGSAGGGSGSAGASGAGGGGMVALPPTDQAGLKAALENGGTGAPKYSPTVAAAKWACSDPDDAATDVELKTTTNDFHNGDEDEAPARYCANYNLSGVTYDQTDGWPLGAAAMKETLDEDGKIIEWSYYALKADGTSWYGARIVPTGDGGDVVPVERDTLIPSDVTLEFTEGGCTGGGCHADPGNTNVLEWVIRGDAVPHDNPMWLAPNPYKQ